MCAPSAKSGRRSEEHTSELQSPYDLVCRLLLEKKIPPLCPWVEPAEVREGTPRALGADWPTEVFSESDEQLVDMEPVLLRDGAHQSLLGRPGGLRANESEPVAHAMDVGVRRDPRFSEAVDEDAVRGLRPDLGKRNELVVGCRHVAPISIEEDPANLLDLDRLLPVEPHRLNQALEIPGICIREGAGRVIFREQLSRRPLRHLVSSSLGQDRRN